MSGQLPIEITVQMEKAVRDFERFRREGQRTATEVSRSFASADPVINRSLNTVVQFNAARAAIAGVTASVGIAVRGFQEWAKSSDEAAASLDKIRNSMRNLMSEIGQDVDSAGGFGGAASVVDAAGNARDAFGVIAANPRDSLMTLNPTATYFRTRFGVEVFGDEYRNRMEARLNALATARIVEAEVVSRPRITRMRDAARIDAMRARGDDAGVAEAEFRAEMDRINALRAGIRPGAANARELNSLYDTQEEIARNKLIAAQDRILKSQMAEEESARRTREQAEAKAEAELKAEAAKVRAGRAAEEEYEFSMRSVAIQNQRLQGDEEGARVAELRLEFDRKRYQIANDQALGTAARNSLINRTDALEAQAIAATTGAGSLSPTRRTYQAPGYLASGLAGIGLGPQAFASGQGQTVEAQQLNTLKSIDRTLKANTGARFN